MILSVVVSESEVLDARSIQALENLAHSGICGTQLVLGDRATLIRLGDEERLSARARAYYRRGAQGLTQLGAVIKEFDQMEVGTGKSVPLDVFADVDYCEKSQLLTENITDFNVLIGLARLWLAARGVGLRLNLRPLMGGGSTTSQVLATVDETPSGPVLCVVDSDRKFPGSGVGSTALTCVRAARQLKDRWRIKTHVIEPRELENILPIDLVKLASLHLEGDVESMVDQLSRVGVAYSHYCCLKEGDSLCRMIRDASTKRRQDVLGALVPLMSNDLPAADRCESCVREDGCFSTPGLGTGLLSRVPERLGDRHLQLNLDYWCDDLRYLVRQVASVGLAQDAVRI